MADKTVDLDKRRGMAAQKATSLRRLLSDVEGQREGVARAPEALETQLVAAPAESWADAAEKARYLLGLYASTLSVQDTRKRELLAAVLADFERLSQD